jgi:hypothetical protein
MAPRTDQTDPLSYEKAPSLSFRDAQPGATYKGTIVARAKLVQSRDFETGNPKTWPDGNPVMSVVILLDVDGETRSLWAQKPSSMFAALVKAQKDAGGATMEEGGELYVRFIGTVPNAKNPKLNPAKQYEAKYVPPTHSDPLTNQAPAQQPAQQASWGPTPGQPASQPASTRKASW